MRILVIQGFDKTTLLVNFVTYPVNKSCQMAKESPCQETGLRNKQDMSEVFERYQTGSKLTFQE